MYLYSNYIFWLETQTIVRRAALSLLTSKMQISLMRHSFIITAMWRKKNTWKLDRCIELLLRTFLLSVPHPILSCKFSYSYSTLIHLYVGFVLVNAYNIWLVASHMLAWHRYHNGNVYKWENTSLRVLYVLNQISTSTHAGFLSLLVLTNTYGE